MYLLLAIDHTIGELTCLVVVCFTGDLRLVFEGPFSVVGCLDGLGDTFEAVDPTDDVGRLLLAALLAVDGRLCFLVPVASVGNDSK